MKGIIKLQKLARPSIEGVARILRYINSTLEGNTDLGKVLSAMQADSESAQPAANARNSLLENGRSITASYSSSELKKLFEMLKEYFAWMIDTLYDGYAYLFFKKTYHHSQKIDKIFMDSNVKDLSLSLKKTCSLFDRNDRTGVIKQLFDASGKVDRKTVDSAKKEVDSVRKLAIGCSEVFNNLVHSPTP